jgi:hypothetical protein
METFVSILKKVNWKGLLAALAALGVISTADWKVALIGLAVTVLVWMLNLWVKRSGKKIGRAWLTVIVYLVAMIITIIVQPVIMPALPAWNGDAALFTNAWIGFLAAVAPIAATVTGEATLVYNSILKQVADQVEVTK